MPTAGTCSLSRALIFNWRITCEKFPLLASLAGSVGKTPLQDGPAVDERVKDWLQTSEPHICFDTLEQMEKLLQEDTFSRTVPATSRVGSRGSVTTKDKIDEAVSLLESCKGYFHFLFSTEIWTEITDG
ncbi:hypothetical protein V8E55_008726 [Tylopilus felleus]